MVVLTSVGLIHAGVCVIFQAFFSSVCGNGGGGVLLAAQDVIQVVDMLAMCKAKDS